MRSVTVDDADELAKLDMELFPDSCFNETTLAGEVTRGKGWCIEADGALVAYVLTRGGPRLRDITRLGVLPAYQGQGLGTELLSKVLRKSMRVMLTVRAENTGALRLYLREGFEIVGRLAEGEWVMTTDDPTTDALLEQCAACLADD